MCGVRVARLRSVFCAVCFVCGLIPIRRKKNHPTFHTVTRTNLFIFGGKKKKRSVDVWEQTNKTNCVPQELNKLLGQSALDLQHHGGASGKAGRQSFSQCTLAFGDSWIDRHSPLILHGKANEVQFYLEKEGHNVVCRSKMITIASTNYNELGDRAKNANCN